MRITVLVVSLILGCAGSAHVLAASQDAGSQVEQAELCREIPARLERLACFDRVFATPLSKWLSHRPILIPQSGNAPWRHCLSRSPKRVGY